MDAQNQRCSCGNSAPLLVFQELAYGQTGQTEGRTYGQLRMDSHVTTKIFQIDSGVTKFSKVWDSARTPDSAFIK